MVSGLSLVSCPSGGMADTQDLKSCALNWACGFESRLGQFCKVSACVRKKIFIIWKKVKGKFMSQHRSLRGQSSMAAKRSVLKRFERVELLKKRGQWKSGERVLGLRKTKPE